MASSPSISNTHPPRTMEQSKRRISHPILQTLQGERFMRISRSLIDVCHGSLDEAAMVSTALGWTLTLPESRQGWFYKSIQEWEHETTVKRDRQQRCRRRLNKRSPRFWYDQKRGCPPTNWFRLDLDVLEDELAIAMQRRRDRDAGWDDRRSMSGKPADRSDGSMSGKPADRMTRTAPNVDSETRSTIALKPADHSQENTHGITAGCRSDRSSQDAESAVVDTVENSEQQYLAEFQETAKKKTLPGPGRFRRSYPFPTDPLLRELRAAIYPDQLEKAFFDCQRLKFADQLSEYVKVTVTMLASGRVAKMIGLDVSRLKDGATEKVRRSAAVLDNIKSYEARREQVVNYVMNVVLQEFADEYRAQSGDRKGAARGLQLDLFAAQGREKSSGPSGA
jgi:hypothetical protein